MKPFVNEPTLELRRAPARESLLGALHELEPQLPLAVPVLIGRERGAHEGFESTDPGEPARMVATAGRASRLVAAAAAAPAPLRPRIERLRELPVKGLVAYIRGGPEVILGPPTELSRALLMGAAWVINLAVAEWVIRKRAAPPARTTSKRPLYRGGASFSGGQV